MPALELYRTRPAFVYARVVDRRVEVFHRGVAVPEVLDPDLTTTSPSAPRASTRPAAAVGAGAAGE
jgi:hypothetical protein